MDTITIPILGVVPGDYLVRIQIDGAESLLEVEAIRKTRSTAGRRWPLMNNRAENGASEDRLALWQNRNEEYLAATLAWLHRPAARLAGPYGSQDLAEHKPEHNVAGHSSGGIPIRKAPPPCPSPLPWRSTNSLPRPNPRWLLPRFLKTILPAAWCASPDSLACPVVSSRK